MNELIVVEYQSGRQVWIPSRFDLTWRGLSQLGHCDAAGGAEYLRVFAEWNMLGRPTHVAAFIRATANKRPPGWK